MCVCFFLTAVTTVSVVLVSVLLVISTAIITSIIVWCVMRRRPSSHVATGTSVDHSDKGVTELAPVIYDTPITKEHTITTQDNVAYGGGGTIPLKHNEAYQQVHIN